MRFNGADDRLGRVCPQTQNRGIPAQRKQRQAYETKNNDRNAIFSTGTAHTESVCTITSTETVPHRKKSGKTPKDSKRILTPIRIRTTPPTIVAVR